VLVKIGVDRLHVTTNVFEYTLELEFVQPFDCVSTGSIDTDLPTQIAVVNVNVNIIRIQAPPTDGA